MWRLKRAEGALGLVVFLAGVLIYAATGFIIPSATMFLAFMTGLLVGNPPRWLGWLLRRFGLVGA